MKCPKCKEDTYEWYSENRMVCTNPNCSFSARHEKTDKRIGAEAEPRYESGYESGQMKIIIKEFVCGECKKISNVHCTETAVINLDELICHHCGVKAKLHAKVSPYNMELSEEEISEMDAEMDEKHKQDEIRSKLDKWTEFSDSVMNEYIIGAEKYINDDSMGHLDIIQLILGKHAKWYFLGLAIKYVVRFKNNLNPRDLAKIATYIQNIYSNE